MSLMCYSWGTNDVERRLQYPCDLAFDNYNDTYFRGTTIRASDEIIFRILGQLRVTMNSFKPFNPSEPIPESEELIIGQEIMEFFEITSVENKRHLTIRIKKGSKESKVYGDVAVSYVVLPENKEQCRIIVKCLIHYPKVIGLLLRLVLPWGDLIMMRRQLLSIKRVAEQMEKVSTV
ncbi:MAG: hypothetical protein NTZ34_06890 [Chloroflexi bacterium]|nr:hypothetical protein [Chloroflexota bacterium]